MIDKLIQELKDLKEAKDLLDKMLSHYDIYKKQFKEIPEYDQERLNNEIRKYQNFDDSE